MLPNSPDHALPSNRNLLTQAESHDLRWFLVSIALVITVCIISGFLGIAFYSRDLIQTEMLSNARRNFNSIVVMRRWNAEHGGVYVLKRPGVESNPYLENPDITATDGKVYTLKNPALMTREISELYQQEQGYFFHITSLRPINPHNQPDSQERVALASFEQGLSESWWQQELNGTPYFRYMAPLKVEPGCMPCHAKQGYRLGDVRGGISVSMQMGELQNRLERNSWIILVLALLTISVQVGLVGIFFRSLIRKLADARGHLNRLASTDQLTGLANRYTMFDRLEQEFQRQQRSQQNLSLAMIDIDFFKAVNDNFGHSTGDTVLRQVAEQIMQGMRQYDVAARFGGEEFLLMLPGSDLAQAVASAERLRATIEAQVHVGAGAAMRAISVSIGVACLQPGQNMATLIQRADAALYRAKAAGRNRVIGAAS